MQELITKGRAAKAASRELSLTSSESRTKALLTIAELLEHRMTEVLLANEQDLANAVQSGTGPALLDRLMLNKKRVLDLVEGLRQIAALAEPLGEIMEHTTRPNGLVIHKVRVPLGVVGIIYEARPNVTADVAALCLRTGNAVLLRGSSSALCSNKAITQIIQEALVETGLPAQSVQLIEDTARDVTDAMLRMHEYLDVLIPRGGQGLISHVVANSTVPVLQTGAGNCHIYVDRTAPLSMTVDIVLNAKTQRPAVCNAIETVLVHETWAGEHLHSLLDALKDSGVEILGCAKTISLYPEIAAAMDSDWETEYLDLCLAVKVVASLDEAIAHIERYSTGHSECIISMDNHCSEVFLQRVDAAVVYHNASTRFTDGYEFGLGAEIGISTQKLHARGPMGLRELTSYKYKVFGQGQVR